MNDEVIGELEVIRQSNNGFLRPADVVQYAENPDTALHGFFEWDDTEAAKRYRLAQASGLIRVAVVVNPTNNEKVRAYVSLSSDRNESGGYRAMVEVVNDEVLTQMLFAEALKEIAIFKRKYEKLKEFAGVGDVISAMESILLQQQNAA